MSNHCRLMRDSSSISWKNLTSIRFPPGLLTAGHSYVIRVTTFQSSTPYDPSVPQHVGAFPLHYASAVTS